MKAPAFMLFLGFCGFAVQTAFAYPVTVQSCGKPVTIMHQPEHAVIHDVNMAEMAFALHLQPYIRGLTGISGWNKYTPGFKAQQGDIPEIATHYPSLEQLLDAGTDFFFAGWNYGMHIGGDVTPETLAIQGIPTLVLSESCFRAGQSTALPTLDLLYGDEEKLGQVFGREQQARQLVEGWQRRVQHIQDRLKGHHPLRVFLYDSGRDRPFTAGQYALATELIRIGGGENIFRYLPTNWGAASWENAGLRDPEAILVMDYGAGVSDNLKFLRSQSLLTESTALKTNRVLVVRYDEMTPSPANIDVIEKIAAFLHPDAVP